MAGTNPLRGAASTLRRLGRDERGISAIELAVVLGALIMIIFGTLQFGRAFAARNEMSHALSEAVRLVHLDPDTTTGEIVSYLETELAAYGAGELDVTISEISGTSYMEVLVSFPFEVSIPFSSVSELTLRVKTLAPMVSPVQ
jgi:Flp pilus assembly protein TadG